MALVAVLISAAFVWVATNVTRAPASEADRQIQRVLAVLGDSPPLVTRDAAGRVSRRTAPAPPEPRPIVRIVVLSYRRGSERLIRSDVPFWFFRMKAPAAQMLVRDSQLDLQTLGLTAADLQREGPTLILDETSSDGNRLLVWTE